MTVQIVETRDIVTCRALRRVVFINEQGVSEADEIDEFDDVALHLLATDNGEPVGCARVLIDGSSAKIGRVCVLKPYRATGLGADLIRACLRTATNQSGVTRASLGAQTHALGFYEKLGFSAHGPVFDDAGIDHQAMEIEL